MKKFFYLIISLIFMLAAFSVTALSAEYRLGKVTGLEFVKGEQDTVTFQWNEVKDADFYYIYQYNRETGKYELVASVRETMVTVESLESGTSHYFRVIPLNYEKGKKLRGPTSSIITCVTAPKGDLVVKTADITENTIKLTWNKIAGATGYKVFYYNEEKGKYTGYKQTKKTHMTVKGLEKNTEYKFKVKAYRRTGGAFAYGVSSGEYIEFTHTDGVPKTKAQIAKAYNTLINDLKQQTDITVKYSKEIDTAMLSCSQRNLSMTVENTLNLFKGTLNKKYKFAAGKSAELTPNQLFEPYSETARVVSDDIDSFRIKEVDNGYTISFVLKSDSGDNMSGSYCDGALSLPNPKDLDTTPLKINTSETYYDKATISFAVRDGKLKILKIKGAVLADINFSVSTVSADTLISYSLNEYYKITY